MAALHVHAFGPEDGAPLLLLHGVTSTGLRFRRFVEAELPGVRAIAPDLRGHGDSTWDPPWHLEQHVAWGAELTMTTVDTGEATQIDATGPAYDAARDAFTEAWDGTAPVDMGVGGSIPFIAEFLEAFPEASVLVTGVEDPDTRAHGANEGLHLPEFEKVLLAEALLLRNLG